jgi:glyoxylase-like metal-dependent hydrolase (beta-lactamase superfamily II)
VKVGDWHVDHVIDGRGAFKPTLTFASSTDEDWQLHRDLMDENGMLRFTMGGFLLRRADRTVLVDVGLGKEELMGIKCGALEDNLRATGAAPADVTDVVFTHLHIDHVGWASSDGRPFFPNATYRCSSADWEHFVVAHPGAEAERIAPAAERFERWDCSGTILPGIDGLAAPGHTPGSTVIVVSSGAERAMLLGDVVHCPVQLVDDEWAALFDVDPDLARRTRNNLARELEGTDTRMTAAHFPEMSFGRLVRAEGRRRWVL